MTRVFSIALASFLATYASAQTLDVLMIGDSVFEWNGAASVPQIMSADPRLTIRDESVGGARFSHPRRLFVGPMDIRAQVPRLPFDWVVITGGANDLAVECGCEACDATVDTLISDDGVLGEIPDFLTDLTGDGLQVLWAQYYAPPATGGPFTACVDELVEINARLTALAETNDAVHLANLAEAIDPSDLSLYDPDLVHPSPAGSAKIAAFLIDKINTLRP